MKKSISKSRLTAILLSLLMIFSLVPTVSNAAAEYEESGATAFVFSDDGIAAEEGDYDGYKISGCDLTINKAGTYILSGSCSDGSIKVKKGTTGVTLVLDGLTLTSSTTAPLACNKSSEVNIVVASGTVNNLTDNAQNNDDNYPDNADAENAVIKCKDGSKVTLGGSGTLNITANGKNGIKSGVTTDEEGEAYLIIRDVTLNITASINDAINAEQLLNIESGSLTISAADDAVHCDLEMNVGAYGTEGPSITINECYEGLEAATLNIYSGNINITASDDCLNAANSDLTDYDFSMNIYGGSITAYTSEGDGFDSNGSLTIADGTVVIWTANTADNQPLDADGTITITGGTVLAAGGSAGMGMTLNAVQPYVVYGSTGMGGGRPDGQPGEAPNGQPGEAPSGQPGDGQQGEPPAGGQPGGRPDDNGSGNVGENGNPPSGAPDGMQPGQGGAGDPAQGGNGAQPGNSGSSIQISEGSTVAIKDGSGNVIYSGTVLCNAGFVFFSSPELTSGSSYTLYADDASAAESEAKTGAYSGSDGQQIGQPTDGSESTASGSSSASETISAPQTGDESHIGLLVTLLIGSAATLTVFLVSNRRAAKKKENEDA